MPTNVMRGPKRTKQLKIMVSPRVMPTRPLMTRYPKATGCAWATLPSSKGDHKSMRTKKGNANMPLRKLILKTEKRSPPLVRYTVANAQPAADPRAHNAPMSAVIR